MLFNSVIFVLFFAFTYALYLILNHRMQNLFLLVMSYVFYTWWDWRFAGLILASTLIDYAAGLFIEHASTSAKKKMFLFISVCSNLGILFFFKYFNFFAESFTELFNIIGFSPDPVTLRIILPVGISFYTFQSMSYTIDLYRGSLKPTRNFINFALYVSFFPQLVAGPIERASHLLPQVEGKRSIRYEDIREGCWLILLGYFKKVVVADNLAVMADAVFNNPDSYSGLATLLGIYAFAFQIYGDFSGYSDIARGISKLMGFDLMLNFRMPYFAQTPQEFWRRWHISLSTWLRDYLYVPLGGNRYGTFGTYRNLFLTMLLGGLWHGAAWNFVFWGAYQGAILIVHRLLAPRNPPPETNRVLKLLKIVFMFHVVCLGWILFRINTIGDFPVILTQLFQPAIGHLDWALWMALLLWPVWLLQYAKERSGNMLVVKNMPPPVRAVVYGILFGYILLFGKVDGNEFIYFQF